MKIDTDKATIWGEHGGATYHINDTGGLELDDIIEDGLTDAEYAKAEQVLTC